MGEPARGQAQRNYNCRKHLKQRAYKPVGCKGGGGFYHLRHAVFISFAGQLACKQADNYKGNYAACAYACGGNGGSGILIRCAKDMEHGNYKAHFEELFNNLRQGGYP